MMCYTRDFGFLRSLKSPFLAPCAMSFDPDLVRALESYGHVLTTRLQDVKGPRAYFRDAEIELLERHLDHARHNSFLLVGPSGGGKTAILYELFRRVGLRENKPWLSLKPPHRH